MHAVENKLSPDTFSQFPYTIKPPSCRINDLKKRLNNKVKMQYVTCNICGGRVERWADEDIGFCLDCKSEHHYHNE